VAVVGYAGVRLWPYILETRYIEGLDSADSKVRSVALEWLKENGSVRAVPKLIEMFRAEEPRSSLNSSMWTPFSLHISKVSEALVGIGRPSVEPLAEIMHQENAYDHLSSRAELVLYLIGANGLKALLRCVDDHDDEDCLWRTLWILCWIGEEARPAEEALRRRALRESYFVKDRIDEVLRALHGSGQGVFHERAFPVYSPEFFGFGDWQDLPDEWSLR
ncbi:MAG: hypothetical protein AAF517_10550, partial [Planctomycetota bacterium]